MMKGRCNCGEVEFTVDGKTSQVIVCHCSICRKATGSGGIAIIIAANDRFRWVQGEKSLKTWRKPIGDWLNVFCKHCGSPMPRPNCEQTMAIPAGLLIDGDKSLAVAHHIFVHSKAAWEEIGDDGKQHPEAFTG